jgi:hypothetical protein
MTLDLDAFLCTISRQHEGNSAYYHVVIGTKLFTARQFFLQLLDCASKGVIIREAVVNAGRILINSDMSAKTTFELRAQQPDFTTC